MMMNISARITKRRSLKLGDFTVFSLLLIKQSLVRPPALDNNFFFLKLLYEYMCSFRSSV